MQGFTIQKFGYALLSVLSLIYIILLFGMIEIHYHIFSSIDNALLQYNWKYWFEESCNCQTLFSIFLQFIDNHYLHSRGIIAIVINTSFILLLTTLIITIIRNLYHTKEKYTLSIQTILIFSTVIILFSVMQDSSIVWLSNQQIFAAYFFPLLSYYLLVKFSITKNNKYFYALLLSSMMIIISTPYYFSALVVLFFIGYGFKIGWIKNLLILTLVLLSLLLYYNDMLNNAATLLNLFNEDMASKIFLYILNYLGSLFIYMSFEPCIATSSIIGGFFIVSTVIYFSYIMISKRSTEKLYWVILSFLFFYILTAFGSLSQTCNSDIVIFKNQYMTPSLIAWSLIFILYIHYFSTSKIIQRRILTLSLTLIVVLYFYQIITYQNYKQDVAELKLSVLASKLEINDKRFINDIKIMMYSPSKESSKKMSMFTVDDIKAEIIHSKVNLLKDKTLFTLSDKDRKNLVERSKLISTDSNQILKCYLDKTILIDKKKKIIKLLGWMYDTKEKKVPKWFIVLDEKGNIIGYIMSGEPRKDVEMLYGKDASGSGFVGYLRYLKMPTTLYMVDELGREVFKVKYPRE